MDLATTAHAMERQKWSRRRLHDDALKRPEILCPRDRRHLQFVGIDIDADVLMRYIDHNGGSKP
jgi:hypothetical protein